MLFQLSPASYQQLVEIVLTAFTPPNRAHPKTSKSLTCQQPRRVLLPAALPGTGGLPLLLRSPEGLGAPGWGCSKPWYEVRRFERRRCPELWSAPSHSSRWDLLPSFGLGKTRQTQFSATTWGMWGITLIIPEPRLSTPSYLRLLASLHARARQVTGVMNYTSICF